MLTWISLLFLLGFFVAGGLDGIYFHIARFRLWSRPESRLEHALHAARAVLLPPTIWALYLADRRVGLSLAVFLVALDVIATVMDVIVEPESRKGIGGLPLGEVALHVAATVFHVGALGLAFAAQIYDVAPPRAEVVMMIATALVVMSSIAAVHHLVLIACGSPAFRCGRKERTA
jgi:hypothetical protein